MRLPPMWKCCLLAILLSALGLVIRRSPGDPVESESRQQRSSAIDAFHATSGGQGAAVPVCDSIPPGEGKAQPVATVSTVSEQEAIPSPGPQEDVGMSREEIEAANTSFLTRLEYQIECELCPDEVRNIEEIEAEYVLVLREAGDRLRREEARAIESAMGTSRWYPLGTYTSVAASKHGGIVILKHSDYPELASAYLQLANCEEGSPTWRTLNERTSRLEQSIAGPLLEKGFSFNFRWIRMPSGDLVWLQEGAFPSYDAALKSESQVLEQRRVAVQRYVDSIRGHRNE